MRYKEMRRKIESGSDRDKKNKTKKQFKWLNPFYRKASKRNVAFKKLLTAFSTRKK